MSESLKNKSIKGVGWSFADNLSNQGVTFLVGLILARLLSPEEYGLIGIISIFIALFNSFVDSGFSNALIRKNDVKDVDYHTAFITNVGISIPLYIVFFLCSPLISNFFKQPQLEPLAKVMGFILIINAFGIIQRAQFTKRIDFKTQTKVSLISSLSSGLIGIILALCGYGVWALVSQQLVRQGLNTLFLWVYGHYRPQMQFSKDSFCYLLGFGWKLLCSGLLASLWRELYQVVIGRYYSASSLGQFTRAKQFAAIFSQNINSVVMKVSYPVLSTIQDDDVRLLNGYRKVIKTTTMVSFTCMLTLFGIAKPMILSVIGAQWTKCVPMLQIICFSMMLYPLHAINLNILKVKNRTDLFLKLEIIKKFIAIPPIIAGIFIDIYAMLFSSVLAGFVSLYVNAMYTKLLLNYSVWEQVRDVAPSFFKALAMGGVLYIISLLPINCYCLLFLDIIVAIVLFFILNESFKSSEYLEIKSIAGKIISKICKKNDFVMKSNNKD